ncbi:MAG: hypothetical protein PHI90_10190, partial [Clostridia bacterium]|nr:hypothetical protein [Clostridia bacterium]
MPQINRLRIINFSYNNHNRHIVDETFDLYQGQDALLSLKNGGGKSVLVQLLFQPIIPKIKLMNRRMEDFFKGKKTPSYVLIEWKLEEQGGYLLTGIGLSNRESQVREQDEINSSLKYFTFTSSYQESNQFDLKNIPLVKKQDEKIYIESFKDVKKLISLKEKDMDLKVRLFTDEDKLEYKKHLSSYNISQDEWESIILKINESEGGVIEIFEKCKTSLQLMNDWLLKSIEKVVNKEDRDQKKLEQMLENLVEEMINNEQFIYEKEIYQEFLKESEKYLGELESLVVSLDKEKDVEQVIARMYYYLKCEINKMTAEIKNQNEKISFSEKELKRIDLEERSKEYYDILNKVNEFIKLSKEEEDKLKLVKSNININEKEAMVLLAAREYARIKELRQRLAGINEEIEKIKNSDESKEKIRDLEYSLKISYEKELERLNKKLSVSNNKLSEIVSDIGDNENKIKSYDIEGSNLQNKKGRVEGDIKNFEKYEEKIKEKLDLKYLRNLLGEIDEDYKNRYFDEKEQKIASLNSEKESIKLEKEKCKNNIIEMNQKVSTLRDDNADNIVEAANLANKLKSYYEIEELVKPVLDKYDIDWKRRFNHEENKLLIKTKINELQKAERDLDLNVRTKSENIASLKNGTLHVSKEFREVLINKDIAFETGENYLRKQSEGIRNSLIEHNPMLPFAFLLYDDDLKLLKGMDIGFSFNQLIPIILYSDIKQEYDTKNNYVQLEDKLQLLCLYDNKMIDADSLDSYINELNKELNEVKGQLVHYRGELDKSREDLQALSKFDFSKNYIFEIETEKEKIEKKINNIRKEIEELEEEKSNASVKIDEFNNRINLLENELIKVKEDVEEFKEFVEEDREYVKNMQLYKSYLEIIESINKQKGIIINEICRLNKDKDNVKEQRIRLKNELNSRKDSLKVYEDAQEGKVIVDEIDNMEERLRALKANITFNLGQLEADKKSKQDDLQNSQDTLASYNLDEEEYLDKIFDQERLRVIQDMVKELKRDEERSANNCRDVDRKLQNARGRLESKEEEIKRLGEEPLESSLIKLNFNMRRKEENETMISAKNKINELIRVSRDYSGIVNRIEIQVDIKGYEVQIDYKVKKSVYEDYEEQTNELKCLQEENRKYEKNASSYYYKLKANYKDKNIHIQNIFIGLEPLIEGARTDRNKYYYLGERILDNNDSLNKLISVCEQRLSNLEKNKNDMVQHSYLQAKQVYEEIQKIAENSSIKLEGKSRPIPMLKIDMVPLDETEEE